MSRVTLLAFVVGTALAVSAVAANASSIAVDPTYWGSSSSWETRTTGAGGLVGTGEYSGVGNDGFQVAWWITESAGAYTYRYDISGVGGASLDKALSHWIVQLTSDPLIDWSGVNWNPNNATYLIPDPLSPKWHGPGYDSGNPEMPVAMFGFKWDTSGDPSAASMQFTTAQAPVWGDMWAKSGGGQTAAVYAHNVGFGTMPTSATLDFTNWIARPNGDVLIPPGGNPVPEPATLILVGAGLVGGYGARRRRRR